MQTHLTVAGIALLLLSSSIGTAAYHITGAPGSAGSLGSAHQWNSVTAVTDPATGDVEFALVICEQDDYLGLGSPTDVSIPGQGGLCFMSPGYGMVGTACVVTEVRSNGVGPDYTSSGACGSTGTATVGADWINVQMLDENGVPIPFVGLIDGFSCAAATTAFVYDGRFAYTTDNGHVTGFPARAAGYASGTTSDPMALGTYAVSASAAPSVFCDPPRPISNGLADDGGFEIEGIEIETQGPHYLKFVSLAEAGGLLEFCVTNIYVALNNAAEFIVEGCKTVWRWLFG